MQKSTSGAWQSAPGRDERAEAALSSPSSFGSVGRKSVGSRTGAAKSRDRWRAGIGPCVKARGHEQALDDGRRPGPNGTAAFDEAAGKAVLAVRAALRRTRIVTGASEVDMLGPSTEDNAVERGAPPVGPITIEDPAGSGGVHARRIGGGVNVINRSSKCAVKRTSTRVVCWGFGSIGRGEQRASAAATSGIERTVWCTCRESVAEVGEEHLPRAIEGSREANREDAM